MRTKLIIGLIGLAFAVAAFLFWPSRKPRQEVALVVTGYSDSGTKAKFGVTNTSDYFMAGGRPTVEYLTPAGWTNYYDEEVLMPAHAPSLHSGAGWCDERKLPPGVQKWRAHVTYRLYPEDAPSTPAARLGRQVRTLLGMGAGTVKSPSSELRMVRTPEMSR